MKLHELIEKYQQQTIICFNVDYGSGKSVRANNKAVGTMFKIIADIDKNFGNDGLHEFSKLLTQNDNKINLWAATQLLERTKPDNIIITKALSVIQAYSKSENPDAFIYKDWLKNWNDNNPDEQTFKAKHQTFKKITVWYAIVLLTVSFVYFAFPDRFQFFKINFLFYYLMTIYLLNSLYYFALQQKIKKMTSPLFRSLSALCIMGGLAFGIIILLLLKLLTIEPNIIFVFSSLYFIITVGTGRKYWLGSNWYDR